MRIITDERCTGYLHPGHPERPERILATWERLRGQSELPITWSKPGPADDAAILRAHTPEHLARLSVPEDFDADTPAFPDLADYARASVRAALDALKAARAGETVFSLMRPPGHHATRNRAMGFCYLNNIAIAALEALATGAKRVAVFDFDVHHGNGTEAILLNKPGAAFLSIHQFPCYPGTGEANERGSAGNIVNATLAPGATGVEFRWAWDRVILPALDAFAPELLIVSAGFDAHKADPLAQLRLETADFAWVTERLLEVARRHCGGRLASLLEGGYDLDALAACSAAHVRALLHG